MDDGCKCEDGRAARTLQDEVDVPLGTARQVAPYHSDKGLDEGRDRMGKSWFQNLI